jgi:dTDP-4-dehydrorhamnose 3,5-epimerase
LKIGPIDGAVAKDLARFPDERGFFQEILRASEVPNLRFAQLSWCRRRQGAITAWHIHPDQWDWWFVPHGIMKAVLHDLRKSSPTHRTTYEIYLGENARERVLTIPPGVAHGYKVIEGPLELFYMTSHEYNRDNPAPPVGQEGRIPHDDAAIGYDWLASQPIR